MLTFIYRCSRKPDMYIYLTKRDDFSKVPKAIVQSLGTTQFAMEIEISADSKLAREKPEQVLHNLNKNGFHLQLPPPVAIERVLNNLTEKQ